jgi:transmembrane sensor
MKSQPVPTEDTPMHSAESWVVRLASPEFSEQDRDAFEAWCAEGPGNLAAFRQLDRLHERARELKADPLVAAAARTARRRTAAGRQGRIWAWGAVAAGLGALALTALLQWPATVPAQRHVTAVGEQRELRLPDGTRALLDTDSELSVRYGQRREVTLERGRVELDIAAQKDRPFVLLAANGTINDIGTRFQVARSSEQVTVVLLEGEVSVTTADSDAAPTVLKPGRQASFGPGRPIAQADADLEAAQAWKRGELVFNNRPLAELVREMNRYSTLHIRLAEPGLDNIAVSGLFHAGDQAALVKALESGWSLRAERVSDSEIVLHAPQRQ